MEYSDLDRPPGLWHDTEKVRVCMLLWFDLRGKEHCQGLRAQLHHVLPRHHRAVFRGRGFRPARVPMHELSTELHQEDSRQRTIYRKAEASRPDILRTRLDITGELEVPTDQRQRFPQGILRQRESI